MSETWESLVRKLGIDPIQIRRRLGEEALLAEVRREASLPTYTICDEDGDTSITMQVDPRDGVIVIRQSWSGGEVDEIVLSPWEIARIMEIVYGWYGEGGWQRRCALELLENGRLHMESMERAAQVLALFDRVMQERISIRPCESGGVWMELGDRKAQT